MSFGILSPEQSAAVQAVIKQRHVCDLGCGDMELSVQLKKLGALSVLAVDKRVPQRIPKNKGIEFKRYMFEDLIEVEDVAFVSWPDNLYRPDFDGIVKLVKNAKTVIYLGKNTEGNACGTVELFDTMLMRDVVAHVPNRKNTLIITEKRSKVAEPREPLAEEFAAIYGQSPYHAPLPYSE